ncbi:MAG: hypothetical protein J4F39_06555 [Candidatus Latescibacteria bacterium]|nr:hypothetical protein [Candidatus Latescibacterota bacterium]
MNKIALDNSLGIYSEPGGAFSSCASLPIHQTMLTYEEMAAIDGLWEWDEALAVAAIGAVGAVVAVSAAAKVVAMIPPPTGIVLSTTIIAGAAVGGAAGAVAVYTLNELRKKRIVPEAKTAQKCKCDCACCN